MNFSSKLLLGVIIATLVIMSSPVALADIQLPDARTDLQGSSLKCEPFWTPSTLYNGCPQLIIVYILELILRGVSWAITIAAAILNVALKVQNQAFYNQPIVNIGWKIARDVVNIFYVLILLIIAIATILGISSYSMKNLLGKLLLSALLVNFSLPLAGVVIDASNALGNTFYAHMGVEQPDGTRDIATAVVDGFQISRIWEIPHQNNIDGPPAPVVAIGAEDSIFNIIIAYLMGTVLELIMAFVMLAAVFLLVARIVYLWLILIVAPFAFLFLVLPRTSSIFNQWIGLLFNQSFFYPAYMFFLYLVVRAIDSGVIQTFYKSADQTNNITQANASQNFGTASAFTSHASLILSFVTLAILLVASLIVAKKMGAEGANAAISYGNKLQKSATGAVSSFATRNGQILAGKAAGSTISTNTLGRIPLVRRGIASTIQAGAKAAEYRGKTDAAKIKNVDPVSAARMMGTLSAAGQAQAFKAMDEKRRGEVAKEMAKTSAGQLNLTRVAQNIANNKDIKVKKEETAAFVSQGLGIHAAMEHYYKDMQGEGAADNFREHNAEEYSRRVNDVMNFMTPGQRKNIYDKELENNQHIQDYFVENEKDLKHFYGSREDIMKGSRFIEQFNKRFAGADAGETIANINKRYGSTNKVVMQINGSIGSKLLLSPHTIPTIRSKDDIIEKKVNKILAGKKSEGDDESKPKT